MHVQIYNVGYTLISCKLRIRRGLFNGKEKLTENFTQKFEQLVEKI